ncbi:hypothetical protein FK178_05920 [Antarcticibacterium arcticum]|uniref:PRC-barrel domain-containing protein n=1 Tax=Antarcticibacterium arcticum TaxID=2585771 RepID=A0A5B8YJJ5_9FLAO|nr:hypothetical protein [Antarcticibacterium arcticum]QED37278.1 hypothetical protein FK178_05920 [Antarcticibacterium arcticum]
MAHKSENKNKNLYYLNELSDYKVSSDDPDVRGWQVKDADNRVIGKVDNLLVNKEIEKVLYLDVEVDPTIIEANHDPYGTPANEGVHEFINKEGENHIIIPVGLVNLNNDQKFVYTDTINYQTFAETKRFARGHNINRDYEVVVLDTYGRDRNRPADSSGRSDRRGEHSHDDTSIEDRRQMDPAFQEHVRRDADTHDKRADDLEWERRESERRADDLDWERRESERRAMEARQVGDRGRIPDDNSFYERREFDDSNYRRRR